MTDAPKLGNEADVNALLSWPTEAALALLEMIANWPKPDCAFHELSPAWDKAYGDEALSMGLALRELKLRGVVESCRDRESGLVSCVEIGDRALADRYLGGAVPVEAGPRRRPSALAA